MLKNDQTYLKNLAVFSPQHFEIMFYHLPFFNIMNERLMDQQCIVAVRNVSKHLQTSMVLLKLKAARRGGVNNQQFIVCK